MYLNEARQYLQLFDLAVLNLRNALTHEEALAASSRVQLMCPTVVLAMDALNEAVDAHENDLECPPGSLPRAFQSVCGDCGHRHTHVHACPEGPWMGPTPIIPSEGDYGGSTT
jgi:hypothetical protein